MEFILLIIAIIYILKPKLKDIQENNEPAEIEEIIFNSKSSEDNKPQKVELVKSDKNLEKYDFFVERKEDKLDTEPQNWNEYIGQGETKETIQETLEAVLNSKNTPYPHILISGCFVAGTKVLLANNTWKNIEDIKIGDIVVGFNENTRKKGATRKIEPTKVTNTMKKISEELVLVKSDKNEVWTTPNHKFLTTRNDKTSRWIEARQLFAQQSLYNFPIYERNYEWKRGWLIGSIFSDGSIPKKSHSVFFYNKNKQLLKYYLKTVEEIYQSIPHICEKENGTIQLSIANYFYRKSISKLEKKLFENFKEFSLDFLRGVIAGFYDGDGTKGDCIQFPNTNLKYLKLLEKILNYLEFKTYLREKKRKPSYINGYISKKKWYILSVHQSNKFLMTFQPISKYKNYGNMNRLDKQEILVKKYFRKSYFKTKKIRKVVYDLTTENHTYIANGFPVHNSAGYGKSALIHLLAKKSGLPLIETVAGNLKDREDIYELLAKLPKKFPYGILFIDELAGLDKAIGEILLPTVQTFKVNNKPIPYFTLAGATTDLGLLNKKLSPLVDRCKQKFRLNPYTNEELAKIINNQAEKRELEFTRRALIEIASRSRETPRIALGYLDNIFYYALYRKITKIDKQIVIEKMEKLKVYDLGITQEDIELLKFLSTQDKPVGIQALTQVLNVDKLTYSNTIEPFLVRKRFINRTPRGRIITNEGLKYLNRG